MILTRIQASNVLKYERLEIDLPRSGLIAISGQNESGKSSIGETVCFALFGRTFSISEAEIEKVVRWGENHCNVVLEFEVDGEGYVLSRFLDRDGNHSAKLSRPGTADAPLARGVQNVAEAMRELLGYAYEEFVESFYLAQREITTPHPHSQAVKIMAGVAPLEKVTRELESEIAERGELLEEIQAEYEAVEQEIAALAIQDGHLEELERTHADTRAQGGEVARLRSDMQDALGLYDSSVCELYRTGSRRGRSTALRALFFLLAVVFGGIWVLFTYGADLPQAAQLHTLVQSNTPQGWPPVQDIWFGWAGAGAGALFLLFWIRSSSLGGTERRLRAQAGALAEHLRAAREIEVEEDEAEAESPEMDSEEPGETVSEDARELLPQRPDDVEFDRLYPLVMAADATVRETREYTERELAWLQYVESSLGEQARDINDELVDERGRLAEAENLATIHAGLMEKREEVNARISVRRTAEELLSGAIMHQSNHFNRDIKNLVGRTLPLFTEGRYEHLQIDGNLTVRVFSNDKRDFMDLEEVSSGTQRQVMLALRLALSQKLLSRAVKGQQFAFLDEPFAFFDEERTRHALKALTQIGDGLTQVWIVAQSFPESTDLEFDANVHCERGENSLVITRDSIGMAADAVGEEPLSIDLEEDVVAAAEEAGEQPTIN